MPVSKRTLDLAASELVRNIIDVPPGTLFTSPEHLHSFLFQGDDSGYQVEEIAGFDPTKYKGDTEQLKGISPGGRGKRYTKENLVVEEWVLEGESGDIFVLIVNDWVEAAMAFAQFLRNRRERLAQR